MNNPPAHTLQDQLDEIARQRELERLRILAESIARINREFDEVHQRLILDIDGAD